MYTNQSIARSPIRWLAIALLSLLLLLALPLTARGAEPAEDTNNFWFMEQNTWEYQGRLQELPASESELLDARTIRFLEMNVWEFIAPNAHPAGSPDNPALISVWLFDNGRT